MKNKWIPKSCLIGLSITFLLLLSSCGINNDLNDITADIATSSVVFKRERGFGNDRFDIYSFSLKKPKAISNFHQVSEESERFFSDQIGMIDIELMNDPSRASSLKTDIDKVKNQEDGQYLYLNLNGTSKLYVYSPTLNMGYCLILVI